MTVLGTGHPGEQVAGDPSVDDLEVGRRVPAARTHLVVTREDLRERGVDDRNEPEDGSQGAAVATVRCSGDTWIASNGSPARAVGTACA